MATQTTITVRCPDGVDRRAQITSYDPSTDVTITRLSVRFGGRRVAGFLGATQTFIPSGAGKNGNPFRYLTAA